ncbi:class I SAM-dependent methyltransferase [Pseudoblastomonas halimionae]|nr:class I SAM-dependent methyltransferase [Alteriqipengyuania halimionae]
MIHFIMGMEKHATFTPSGFFNRELAEAYDRRNSGLKPISDALHFLIRLVLADLPARSRVLCVGVGTGADIFALADAFPDMTFVASDPAPEMIEIARRRVEEAELSNRVELVTGYVDDVDQTGFDAALCLLVAHFVQRDDRPAFYRAIHDRLAPGGHFVSAEISADFGSPEFPGRLEDWKQVHRLMGANEESLDALEDTLRGTLQVVSPAETEALWIEAGFAQPIPFFQSAMIHGWHARRVHD